MVKFFFQKYRYPGRHTPREKTALKEEITLDGQTITHVGTHFGIDGELCIQLFGKDLSTPGMQCYRFQQYLRDHDPDEVQHLLNTVKKNPEV